ncbi:MAG: divalent-cation tolerance protein CutA [Pseudomonadota bacterium]
MALKLVYSTFPSVASAEAAGRRLVSARLAACANILPAMISIYEWQGSVERADEVVLLLKTTSAQVGALMTALDDAHPYDVPAIFQIAAEDSPAAFAAWVEAQTRPAAGSSGG